MGRFMDRVLAGDIVVKDYYFYLYNFYYAYFLQTRDTHR